MTGHHEVCVFRIPDAETDTEYSLPEGWKPYGSELTEGVLYVYARRWVREQRPRTQEVVSTWHGSISAVTAPL